MFPQEDVDLLHTMLESQGHRKCREDVRRAGPRHPDGRHRSRAPGWLPSLHAADAAGTKKVWQGLERLNWAVQVRDALGRESWNRSTYKHLYRCGTLKVRVAVKS